MIDPRPAEQKSFPNAITPVDLSFADFLLQSGHHALSAHAAIQMYSDAMPFFNAVETRARNFSRIPPRVWDKNDEKFTEHPVEALLAKPNAACSRIEFLTQYSSYFDITGDAFLLATGRVENPPLELMTVPPQAITFGTSNRFGILHVPDWIQVSLIQGTQQFMAEEGPDGIIRYYNRDRNMELWHSKTFNPRRSGAQFWGMSKAQSVWLEIQQYLSGNSTNWAMLKNGSRIPLAWVNNRGEELTETQWDRIQDEAKKYIGEANAGKTPILDGMDVKPIQQSNKDMEYKDLQENMLIRINIVYGVPMAFLVPKAMTMNNLATSQLQLYDNAIIPLTDSLYSDLSMFLLPRYDPDAMNLWELRWSEGDIPALRGRTIETAKAQNELNVNTMNEIRAIIGDEALDEGGDVVLIPSTNVPMGEDGFTEDNLQQPDTEPPAKSRFMEIMRKNTQLTDAELEVIAKRHGLEDAIDA